MITKGWNVAGREARETMRSFETRGADVTQSSVPTQHPPFIYVRSTFLSSTWHREHNLRSECSSSDMLRHLRYALRQNVDSKVPSDAGCDRHKRFVLSAGTNSRLHALVSAPRSPKAFQASH